MMPDYRVSFLKIEEGVAKLALYKDEDHQDVLYYDIEDLPDGAQPTDQFRPEFNDDKEVVTLHYDDELTERKSKDFKEIIERRKEKSDDS